MPTIYRPTRRDIRRMITRLEKHTKQEVYISAMFYIDRDMYFLHIRDMYFLHIDQSCKSYSDWPSLLEAFNKALESPYV